jgi:hypothetical protein
VGTNGASVCVQLFDVTAGVAVPNSLMCRANPDPNVDLIVRIRSGALSLSIGQHEYALMSAGRHGGGALYDGRIIATSGIG